MALYFQKQGDIQNPVDMTFVRVFFDDDTQFAGKTKEEILAQFNVYAIEGEIEAPPGKIVVDYGAAWTDGDPWPHLVGIFADMDLTGLKEQMKLDLAQKRWEVQSGGFTYVGYPFSSDDKSLVNYVAILMAASMDPNYTVNFKCSNGEFLNLNALQAAGLAMACRSHVQSCFDLESAKKALIDSAANYDELQAIDLNSGWPS